ncbi:ClpXP protease specificity-enhancing factor [Quisquiliibacterium transsilvanicum]|uniref:Stringent starvation protein B n=1 Tax=Quisquiliibacterium transsilvanicum TaxID=1549638 RepID=A0A7W8M9M4_9BURK|nr:ClpXP protease specificity-enhancing factor [Quisquiliibacterium transsilvanicum]MBB5273058.1 stringent starvation protein B [Quisquiliibacterium transsilvanicum]
MSETSTKPYLIRAIHEWCVDNGYRPYIAVTVDQNTIVPLEFVRDGEIVLNVSSEACNRLRMGNDLIEFEARFNRVARQISIPVENVSAVYAAETGQGMAFEVQLEIADEGDGAVVSPAPDSPEPAAARPALGRGPVLVGAPRAPEPPAAADAGTEAAPGPSEPPPSPPGQRPRLTRVK